MSNAVRHRYEKMGSRPSLQFQIQQERYKQNARIDAKVYRNKCLNDMNLRSDWRESLHEASVGRLMKCQERKIACELRMARKATIKVRQAALRQLLDKETQHYETEMEAYGKAFYIKRT